MKFTFISNVVNDTCLIMYKFHRTLRRSDSAEKALAYAEEISAYFLALIVFDFALVPVGLLLAYFKTPFIVTRYFLVACIIVGIYFSKKRVTAMLKARDVQDLALLEQFNLMTMGRWIIWLSYLLVSVFLLIMLGYFYGKIVRLK